MPVRPTSAMSADGPTAQPFVTVNRTRLRVEFALTLPQQAQGLPDRPYLWPWSVNLFVFEEEGTYPFWMNEMDFPSDLVWIAADCSVIHITMNAPPQAPYQTLAELPAYLPPMPARYVLEIHAGGVKYFPFGVGDRAEFTGGLAGLYDC